jgi:NAD-dependent dihydropyrimidine dehydrogenase PreA subunit
MDCVEVCPVDCFYEGENAKSPWRAYLDLDFRVTKKRRSNKVLDTLKKEYRRTSTAHRGQHKTQRGVGVFVTVDIENFLRSSKTFHQSRELTPVAQTVDFESH